MIKAKTGHKVGTRDEWLAAREALLERETLDEQEIIKVSGIRPAPRTAETPTAIPTAAFTDARPTA